MSSYGHRPAAQGESGPYAYWDNGPYGVGGGFGLWNYNSDDPDVKGGAGALFLNGGAGQFNDINGDTTYGLGVQGGLYKGDVKRTNANMGAELGLGTVQAGLFANKNTTSLGVQANAAEIAASQIGTAEHNLRFGLSAGSGWAGRVHYGDSDGDKVPEAGFGFDLGPVSFDLKSELVGHGVNGVKSMYKSITDLF